MHQRPDTLSAPTSDPLVPVRPRRPPRPSRRTPSPGPEGPESESERTPRGPRKTLSPPTRRGRPGPVVRGKSGVRPTVRPTSSVAPELYLKIRVKEEVVDDRTLTHKQVPTCTTLRIRKRTVSRSPRSSEDVSDWGHEGQRGSTTDPSRPTTKVAQTNTTLFRGWFHPSLGGPHSAGGTGRLPQRAGRDAYLSRVRHSQR